MPQWCHKSDALMVSQDWCLIGVKKVMPSWCHKLDALLVSKKWCLHGVTKLMLYWCQKSDAFMVPQTLMPWWCHAFMMLWQCHATVKIKIPTKSIPQHRALSGWSFYPPGLYMGMAKQNVSFWAIFLGLKAPRFKANKHQKEPFKVFKNILSHSFGPHLKLSIQYWLVSDSEVPNPTKHVCPWMKQTPMAVLFLAPSRRQ